ncbi:hypothetical protein [Heyndrickxia acidicola]|uniref:Uncharacterized protein n=1 Tax=Heyndrickxia acidicola TaxID=209389 RepID=A0ABU6MB94_9BACI|nr:hypothetical protein [Heyndrickxia acidicola]MED1201652.1 hypothetical protein [Heyndrickxia acidicola]
MNNVTQTSLESILEQNWKRACGSWSSCNAQSIESFLNLCLEQNVDPQFCMSWVEKHKDKIKDWNEVSKTSLEWIDAHTSGGSAVAFSTEDQ